MRQKLQLAVARFFGRDIGEHADIVGDGASRVLDSAQRHALGEDLATLAPVPDLALPMSCGMHGGPHGVIKLLAVPPGLEHARRLAQHFRFAKAQQARERVVDRKDAAARIGHHHAFNRVVHHGGGQAAAFISFAAGRLIGQQARDAQQAPFHITVRLTTRPKPAVHAVKTQQARCHHQHAALRQRLIHLLLRGPRIFRVQALVEVKVLRQVLPRIAQQRGHARRKIQPRISSFPLPHAAATAFQRQPQHGFAARDRITCFDNFRQILQHTDQRHRPMHARRGHTAGGAQHRRGMASSAIDAFTQSLKMVDLTLQQVHQLSAHFLRIA